MGSRNYIVKTHIEPGPDLVRADPSEKRNEPPKPLVPSVVGRGALVAAEGDCNRRDTLIRILNK